MGSETRGELPIADGGGEGNSAGGGNDGGTSSGGRQRAKHIQLLANALISADEITNRDTNFRAALEKITQGMQRIGMEFDLNDLVAYAIGSDGRVAFLGLGSDVNGKGHGLEHILSDIKGDREGRIFAATGLDGVALTEEIVRIASNIPPGEFQIDEKYLNGGLRVVVSELGNGYIITTHEIPMKRE
jgi:hypothetical protein